jgi:tryptophan synthase alpha chain
MVQAHGIERLDAAFTSTYGTAFIPYVMAGDPDAGQSLRYAGVLARYADVIELGIPYSDPLADGPTIQAAGQRALAAGTTSQDVLDMAERLRGGPPVVIMTYLNTVLAPGAEAFLARVAAAGVAGILIPDLPIEESDHIRTVANDAGVALIPFAAPTSSDERLAAIGRHAQGFVYCVAVTGVTGSDIAVDEEFAAFMDRCRRYITAPIAVGFGVRTADDALRVGEHADGVIVGSEIIRIIRGAGSPRDAELALDDYAREIKLALRPRS